MRKLLVLLASACALCAATPRQPEVTPWGVHLDYIDPSVNAGQDFFAHANGKWLKTAEIPPDRPFAGAGLEVSKLNEERMKEIVAVSEHHRASLGEYIGDCRTWSHRASRASRLLIPSGSCQISIRGPDAPTESETHTTLPCSRIHRWNATSSG